MPRSAGGPFMTTTLVATMTAESLTLGCVQLIEPGTWDQDEEADASLAEREL